MNISINNCLIIFYVLSMILCYGKGFSNGINDFRVIAESDNIQKIYEIDNTIRVNKHATIILNDSGRYAVALKGGNQDSEDDALIKLAQSDILDDSVGLFYARKHYYGNTKRMTKYFNKSYSRLISRIEGVYSAKVSFLFPENLKPEEHPKVDIIIDTDESFSTERIKNTVENLLVASISDLKENEIKIDFNIDKCSDYCKAQGLFREADILYRKQDFETSKKYLQQAAQIMPEYYDESLKCIDKIVFLDKKIKSDPNNYKFYIERAELENSEKYPMFGTDNICSDYGQAVKDYEMALKLNPKLYDVYERLGDAYSGFGYKKCEYCKLEQSDSIRAKTKENYEKAMEFTGGNELLYIKLGDIYYYKKDYKKALDLYKKISTELIDMKIEQKDVPYPDDSSYYKYKLETKILKCYIELKQYNDAEILCNKIIKATNDKKYLKYLKQQKFYINLKRNMHI